MVTEHDFKLMNGLHKTLKPFFVESELMIGGFHPVANKPGLHNPNFRPFLSPVPLLAIRFMVSSDPPLFLFPSKHDQNLATTSSADVALIPFPRDDNP